MIARFWGSGSLCIGKCRKLSSVLAALVCRKGKEKGIYVMLREGVYHLRKIVSIATCIGLVFGVKLAVKLKLIQKFRYRLDALLLD